MSKIKRYTKATLAATLVTSAIVPAAVASAEANQTALKEIILELTDGKKVQIAYQDYKDAKKGKLEWATTAKIVAAVGSDDQAYPYEDFKAAKRAANKDLSKTLDILKENVQPADTTGVVPSKIDANGELVAKDETPEEKVNETFFYNLAA